MLGIRFNNFYQKKRCSSIFETNSDRSLSKSPKFDACGDEFIGFYCLNTFKEVLDITI